MRLHCKWVMRLYGYLRITVSTIPLSSYEHRYKERSPEQNTSFKMADVEQLVHSALDSITTEDWRRCVLHCNKLQDDDFIKEGLRDEILEPIIMTINPDDSSESENEDDY